MARAGDTCATAERFVDAAALVCKASRRLGAEGCTVMLHRDSGPPVLAVDNVPSISDEHRLYVVSRAHWDENPVFATLRERVGVLHGDDLVAPLIDPRGWFGTIVYTVRPPIDATLERELSMLATELSVWCTAHGIGRLPDLAGSELPARQHQIAQLAASGRTNHEIGDELGISVNTVKLRLKQVFERLHVCNRTELANVLRRLAPLDAVVEGVTHRGDIAITRPRR